MQQRSGYELGKSEIINEESNEEDESECRQTFSSSFKKGAKVSKVSSCTKQK